MIPNNNKQVRRRGQVRRNKSSSNKTRLSDGPAYAGQQRATFRLEGGAALLQTTITTGVIANAYAISTASILGFAARFGSTFDEYRILGADVRVTPLSASSGVSKMWFDEKSTSAPTLNESQERSVTPFPNTNANAKAMKTMRWRARDLLDLQYSPIGTVVQPATFKTYTEAGTFGAPATVVPLWMVEPVFLVEFRGMKST